jgi:hypothetical protein
MSMLKKLYRHMRWALIGTPKEDVGQFRGRDVRPASEDPHGDPADQMPGYGGQASGRVMRGQFGNVRPASEDPYGDPADQARRRWRG